MAYDLSKREEPTEEAKKEARIVIKTIEKAKVDAAQQLSSEVSDKNREIREKYKAVKMILEKDYPSIFVEPVDEFKSQLYLVDEKGQRKELGTIPTMKGLGKDNYTEKVMKEIGERIREKETQELKLQRTLAEAIGAIPPSPITPEVQEAIRKATEPLEAIKIQADNYFKNFSTLFETLSKLIEDNPLFSYFIEELAALANNPEYAGADLDRPTLDYEDAAETIEADTLHNRAIHLAMERARKRLHAIKKGDQNAVIKVTRADSPTTVYPVDKVNRNVFKMFTKNTGGQYEYNIITGHKGKQKVEPLVMYSLDLKNLEDRLPIVKRLDSFDKRVMIAAGSLYNAGNEYVTLTQIYHQMGNAADKRPSKNDLEKINNSLTKQLRGHLTIDTIEEQKAGYNYPHFKYDSSLLPFERITAEMDGKITNGVIHFFREPPLISFAKGRKQITTIKNEVLQSPVSKTPRNLEIDDYLIEEISAMKRDKAFNRKIFYKTLFKECRLEADKNPIRIKETIETYLKHYQKTGLIQGFEKQKDYIEISF